MLYDIRSQTRTSLALLRRLVAWLSVRHIPTFPSCNSTCALEEAEEEGWRRRGVLCPKRGPYRGV
jgi:hypothetical protein